MAKSWCVPEPTGGEWEAAESQRGGENRSGHVEWRLLGKDVTLGGVTSSVCRQTTGLEIQG